MINLAIYYITKSKSIKSKSNKNIIQNYHYPNVITLEKHLKYKYNFSYPVRYLKKVLIAKIDELRKICSNISCYNFISFIKSHCNNKILLSFVLLFKIFFYCYYLLFYFIFLLLLLFFPINLFVFEFKVSKLDLYSDVQFYLFRMCSIHHSNKLTKGVWFSLKFHPFNVLTSLCSLLVCLTVVNEQHTWFVNI